MGYSGMHERRRNRKVIALDFVILVLVLALAACFHMLWPHCYETIKTEKTYRMLRKESVISLKRQNRDMAGRIRIPGTNIDYPVMQASKQDPEFYLHRDFHGRYSSAGTLFIDAGMCTDDMHFLIYGHHMFSGAMFGRLEQYYGKTAAYRKHRKICFMRFTGRKGNRAVKEWYRVFAAVRTSTEGKQSLLRSGDLSTKTEYDAYVRRLQGESCIASGVRPEFGEPIMTLSTCSYHLRTRRGGIDHSGRFLVAAVRIGEERQSVIE